MNALAVKEILESKTVQALLILIIVYLVFKWVIGSPSRLFKSARENIVKGNAGKDSNTITTPEGKKVDLNALAIGFRNAIFRSWDWLNVIGDGTDEETLYKYARDSRGHFKEVSRVYRALYDSDLLMDVEGDLSPGEFMEFKDYAGI